MAEPLDLAPRNAFGSPTRPSGSDVRIEARPCCGVATVTVRRGAEDGLFQRLAEMFGFDPPKGPRRAFKGGIALMGVGPTGWLAIAEGAAPNWAAQLAKHLTGLASVVDQSGAYGVLRLEGPLVRDLLARGVSIDLHPRSFPVGSAAVTNLGHFGCVLWRLEGPHAFEIAVFRSVAEDVWRWLERTSGLVSPAAAVADSDFFPPSSRDQR